MLQDLRYAFRTLLRMRGAGVTAIVTLALGIGATTTMFGLVDAALRRPVPFPDPDRLLIVYNTRLSASDGFQRLRWSFPHIALLRDAASSLEALSSFTPASIAIGGYGDPEQIDGEIVSVDYFTALGATPRAGRTFRSEEVAGAHPLVVISERLWRERLSANPAVLGLPFRVNDVPLEIIGVMPEGFAGLSGRASLWIPVTLAPRLTYAEYLTTPQHFIAVVARLRDGATLERANAELAAAGSRFADAGSTPATTWGALALPVSEARIDATLRRSTVMLLGAAACVLLIACVNVASLMLARARTRRREMAIRLAVGASRRRLVQQLLTEGLVLATVAGVVGTILAAWGVALVARTSPAIIASARNDYGAVAAFAAPGLDARVLLFALAVTLGTTVLFALVPALEASRPRPAVALKEDDRGAGRPGRALSGFVVSEAALAVVLISGAGLLIASFARLQDLRAGVEADGVLTFWVRPPGSRYGPTDGPSFLDRLLTRVQEVPGVDHAAVNRCTPFAGCSRTTLFFSDRANDPQQPPVIGRHYISPDYFATVGIPLRAGRGLTPGDRADAPPVAVINETAARRFWPGVNPIGRRVWFGSAPAFMDPNRPVEIVGIVGDVKYESAEQPIGPDFYTSFLQFAYPDTMVLVKSRASTAALLPALRAAVASADASVPIYDVLSLEDRIRGALARPRFNATALTALAGGALLLAAVGVYGVMAYSVSSRRREIGVRLALGAGRKRVVGLVLGEGLRLAGIGTAAGIVAAFVVSGALRGLVMDIGPADPFLLAGAAVVMIAVAGGAAVLPALRASRVDPVRALRTD